MKVILVVPQCCQHCTREQNLANAERFDLIYQFREFYNPNGRVFTARKWRELRGRIAALGYPVWFETDDPETVRRVFGIAPGDDAVRPLEGSLT